MKRLAIVLLVVVVDAQAMFSKIGITHLARQMGTKINHRCIIRELGAKRFFPTKCTDDAHPVIKVNESKSFEAWEIKPNKDECSNANWASSAAYVKVLEEERKNAQDDPYVQIKQLLKIQLQKNPDFPMYRLPIAPEIFEKYSISKIVTNASDHFVMVLLLPKQDRNQCPPLVFEWPWHDIVAWNIKENGDK